MQRQKLYTLIAIAKNWAINNKSEFTGENHQDILALYGAKLKGDYYSATTLSMSQLMQVLEHYKRIGFTAKKQLSKYQKATIAAWLSLADAKIVNKDYKALNAWLSKYFGRGEQINIYKMNDEQALKAYQALKKWETQLIKK